MSRQYFDQVALKWDNMRTTFFSDSIRELLIETAQIKEGDIIADLGAGTGYITERASGLKVSIIAVDQSENMLDIMREKFVHKPNIQFLKAHSDEIPIDDNSIDVAMANMYLHHVNDPGYVIKETYRILKPGGKLVFSDLDPHTNEFLIKEHYDRWKGFKRDEITFWLSEAGFGEIRVLNSDGKCTSESQMNQEQASIGIFIAYGEKPLMIKNYE